MKNPLRIEIGKWQRATEIDEKDKDAITEVLDLGDVTAVERVRHSTMLGNYGRGVQYRLKARRSGRTRRLDVLVITTKHSSTITLSDRWGRELATRERISVS